MNEQNKEKMNERKKGRNRGKPQTKASNVSKMKSFLLVVLFRQEIVQEK